LSRTVAPNPREFIVPESFDLDAPCPTITVQAADSKRRRLDVQPIQPALASFLKPWLADKPKGQPIFPVDRWAILEAFKADLRDAGIEYKTEEGFADIHAMRHTYITTLAKSNAPVKVVQTLARHSTPTLTLGVYTHLGPHDQAAALDALPDLTRPAPDRESSALAATGTDSVTPDCHKLSALCQRGEDGSGRNRSVPDVIAGSSVQEPMTVLPLKNRGLAGYSRFDSDADAEGSVSAAGARPGLQNQAPKHEKPAKTKGKASHQGSLAHRQLSDSLLPADLQSIVAAWPTLPDAVRASILMLVKAASGKGGG
jgi:hypothetical protein